MIFSHTPTRHIPTRFILTGLLLVAASIPAAAIMPATSALTDDGRVMRTVEGFYGDLFPEGTAAAPGIRALALDIESGDTVQRLLVPSSQTWRPERESSLIWDSSSETAILVWLSGTSQPGQFTAEFTHYRDEAWGQVASARDGDGRKVLFDTEPTTFVSYDELSFSSIDGSTVYVSRQVVHLVWRETATERLLYLPLVFVDGHYVGWSEVVTLSQVLRKANEQTALDSGMSESLRNLIAVEQQGDALLLGLADPEHNHLGVIAVELLPISLAALADNVLDSILGHPEPLNEGGLQSLSDGIRAQIISVGSTVNLNPAVTEYTAIRVAEWLRTADPTLGRDAIAQNARLQTLDVGSSVLAYTVSDPNTPDGETTGLDLGDFLDSSSSSESGRMDELVRLEVRLDVPAPDLDVEGLEALIGIKGGRLMLTWPQADGTELAYSEFRARDGAWSEARSLALSESFDREQALELLRRRLN